MKKTFKILKIILIVAFIGAFVVLGINLMSIQEHKIVVENIVGKDVSYYRDEPYFSAEYHKYKDADSMQYWVSKATNNLDYVSAENIDTAVSQGKAEDIAYETAQKYDSEFFKSDIVIELKVDTYYEFYIFQLDNTGYKTGKFIVAKVNGSTIEYISMHTGNNTAHPELGLCIGESHAIEIAFEVSTESEFALNAVDNHLVDTGFYKDSDSWIWEVKIYKITENEIINQTDPVELGNYFVALIDATTGEIISYEWIQNSTDYCPLNGEIF